MAGRVFQRRPSTDSIDPLAAALEPPPDETPDERHQRIMRARMAKQVSDEIDEGISREKRDAKKTGKPVKVLLLGQSESGKSTTLKNFQLMCEPKAFRAERTSWRTIIQLNVVRSIRIILDAVAQATIAPGPSASLGVTTIPVLGARDNVSVRSSYASVSTAASLSMSDGYGHRGSIQSTVSRPDTDLLSLRARLLPLLDLEEILTARIANPDHEYSSSTPAPSGRSPDNSPVPSFRASPSLFRKRPGKEREVAVNSGSTRKRGFLPSLLGGDRSSIDTADLVDWDDPSEPGAVLNAASDDMQRLWAHPSVREILSRSGLRLQEESGFFLDEIKVVTAPGYVPTDEHVLRARLKTLGVSEHRMRLSEPNGGFTREFRIFDVGGQRSMVPRWVPYFDDMDTIIFLAPISAFDQALEEDRRVNRLADSFDLWTNITRHPLLKNTAIVLFLNKIDIMQAKLAAGIRLADFYPLYGKRPNDFDSASKFLKKQFTLIVKKESPVPRMFYSHLTAVIDSASTAFVLAGIRDMLMRIHLKEIHLIL
ncbi:hypothetical protein HMN09_00364000 [Mycena chlorophos]|uniref:G-alpha-domain-containing protein n=1 Tax=Mycena chlorophos TaxID=658473 RepID=A0A8H6WH78_MYCCL|nr:hypothetical protein HMN09_00364000 [Mycena chlorophos]